MTVMTEAKRSGLPEPDRTERLPVAAIGRDRRVNTRDINWDWVEAHSGEHFRPAALGTVSVSHRPDGSFIVLDGQHRLEVCKKSGRDDAKCEVFEGLSLVEEAGLVVLLNAGRPLKAVHMFLARVTERDPVAVHIKSIVERCSFEIGEGANPMVLSCVQKLQRLYMADLKRHPDRSPEALEHTLTTIAHAWGHGPGATHRDIIAGIGDLFLRHGDRIDRDLLVMTLKAYPGGPVSLRGNAAGLRVHLRGPFARSVRETIIMEYNEGLPRSRQIPCLLTQARR